jgi:ribosome-binding ATPase YchF (GTP1/OBG family)
MNIAFHGLDLMEGKIKYNDPVFRALDDKFQPAKKSPYYFNFLPGNYGQAEAIAITSASLLDLLILDMDSLSSRLERVSEKWERDLLLRCISHLEAESPLCNAELGDDEYAHMRMLNVLSMKPTVVFEDSGAGLNTICEEVLGKAGYMFFYTAGRQEVHAWLVKKGATALECAARIHSDLARGFIKAEIVPFRQLIDSHNMQSARKEGLTQLVDRDYPVPEQSVLEIRFNV